MAKQTTTRTGIGYEDDICHFCGGNEAGYAKDFRGKTYDACHKCAKKDKGEANEMVNHILDAISEGERIRRENNKAKQIGQVGTPENTFGAY